MPYQVDIDETKGGRFARHKWLEANCGEGQSRNDFDKKPKTWAYWGYDLAIGHFVFAKASDATLFKLTWG